VSAAPTRDAAAYRECTRDPIFLFQARRWVVFGVPDDDEWEFDDEGECVKWTDQDGRRMEQPSVLSPRDLAKRTFGEFDTPCALETWETERVYLSREEAESYGRARAYNYRDGWRVYCVCAEGALGALLREHGEAAWPKSVAS
jgi:hypothetical protein